MVLCVLAYSTMNFYEDTSILVSCEVIKITDIEKMELFEEQP